MNNIRYCILILGVLAFFLLAGDCSASPIIDQEFIPDPVVLWQVSVNGSVASHAQTFTVGITGNLVRIDLDLNVETQSPSATAYFDVLPTTAGGDLVDTTPLFSTTLPYTQIPLSPAFVSINLGSGVAVTVGEQLAIRVRGSELNNFIGWYGSTDPGVVDFYPRGKEYVTDPGNTWFSFEADLGFKTYIDPVPEPSTLALLTLGGVIAFAAKRGRPAPAC
jgi:hypothetical protein